jgi:hypothetical protein
MKQFFTYLGIFVFGLLIGLYITPGPDTVLKTVVKNIDKPLIIDNFFEDEIPVPVEKIRYIKNTQFDTVTVYKPVGLKSFNLTSQNPLRFTTDRLIYSYYDPIEQRYNEDVYTLPKQKLFYGLDIFGGIGARWYDPMFYHTGLRGWLRYKRIGLFAQMEIVPESDFNLKAGISFNLLNQ